MFLQFKIKNYICINLSNKYKMNTKNQIKFSVFKSHLEKPKFKTKTQKPSPSHIPLFQKNAFQKPTVIFSGSNQHHTTKPSRKEKIILLLYSNIKRTIAKQKNPINKEKKQY